MIPARSSLPKLFKKVPVKIGVELGVAAGEYSNFLLNSHKFKKFFCIDKWNDHHNNAEKLRVQKIFKNRNNVKVLHCLFSEAVLMFEDNYFDFIYIDGYAHTGQDDGQTLRQWFKKLKKGGIFSGHDYCQKFWPKTYDNVNAFLKDELKYKIHATGEKSNLETSVFPSWYILK